METITACGDYILLEKDDQLRKPKANNDSPFLSSAVSIDTLGTVAFSNDGTFPKGTRVFYAGAYEKVFIKGCEYLVIKKENIVAKITEG